MAGQGADPRWQAAARRKKIPTGHRAIVGKRTKNDQPPRLAERRARLRARVCSAFTFSGLEGLPSKVV